MSRLASAAPDHRVLRTCVAEARKACFPIQTQPLSTADAFRRGIASFMPFPPGQTRSFSGIHLGPVNAASDWLTADGRQTDGIVVTGCDRCIFSVAWITDVAWVFDFQPCPGRRGDIDRATLWVALDTLEDAMRYLRWRYPIGGPWDLWEGDTFVAWAADAAQT